jgi:hypothetical protein
MKSALADRGSHVCKSAALWWEGRRALPLKRRWRRTRPVPGRGPFESVERLTYQGGEAATQAPVKRPTAGSSPAPGATRERRSPSASWLGCRPLMAETRVRIPVGTPGPCRPTARSPLFHSGDGGAAPPTGTRPRPVEDSSSSKRVPAGSNPAGRSLAPEVRVDGRRATNAETGGSNPPGGATRERSSTGERRPDMPETGVRLPSLAP